MTLLRIFSVVLWHHFAALLISLALLGGALGLWAAGKKVNRKSLFESAPFCLFGLGILHLGLWVYLGYTRFTPFRAFLEGEWQACLSLATLFFLVLTTFFLVGLLIGGCVRGSGPKVRLVYAFDLFGGLLGILWFFIVGSLWGPLPILCIHAGLCFLATYCVLPQFGKRHVWALAPVMILFYLGTNSSGLKFPEGKALFRSEQFIERTVWAAEGRIDILKPTHGIYHGMGGLVKPKPAEYFPYRLLTQDGGAPSAIIGLNEGDLSHGHWSRYLQAAPFCIQPPERVLIIGAGGGLEVVLAVNSKAEQIDAVDLNRGLQRLLVSEYADFQNHLFEREGVNLLWGEGRQFLRKTEGEYDVILLAGVDTFLTQSGGANALAERYLYTVEAVEDALQGLSPRGVLSMTRRKFVPASESLRFLITAVRVLESRGQRPSEECIILFEGPERPGQAVWANCLVKPTGFSLVEVQRAEAWARLAGIQVLASPSRPRANVYSEYLHSSAFKREDFVKSYPIDISPCTDEYPFFFMWGRRDHIFYDAFSWLNGGLLIQKYQTEQAIPMSLILALLSAVLVLIIGVFSGLILRGSLASAAPGGILYFLFTGGAFLLAEISLFHLAEYFSGIASYSYAASVGGLLLGGGLGALSSRWETLRIFVGSSLLFGLYLAGHNKLQVESLYTGILFVCAVSMVMGYCFGALFPHGLKVFSSPMNPLNPSLFLGVSSWASVFCATLSGFSVWYFGMSSLALMAAVLMFGAGLLVLLTQQKWVSRSK